MKPYEQPILHDLGRMDVVTRKSGPGFDPEFLMRDGGDPLPDWWCQLFPNWPGCPGAGSAPTGSSGSGSF